MKLARLVVVAILVALVASGSAQDKPAGVLTKEDVKTVVPASYFYRGQSSGVQMRNSAGIRTKDQRYFLVGMVDTSGYASDVAQKYQGLFITEVRLEVEGKEIKPGEYGFGFTADKFVVTDVGANEVMSVSAKRDDDLKRPVPLKIAEDGGNYRLYAGKKYVSLKLK